MDSLFQDLRFALRTLRKNLSVTVLVTLFLSLAIAGNTVVFSLINGMLYRPLPYEEPHRVVLLGEAEEGAPTANITGASAASYLDWRERQSSFSAMAAVEPTSLSFTGGERAEPVTPAAVSPELFPLLGADAALGRVILPEDAVPGGDRVAVLGHTLWQQRFAGDPGVLGRVVELNGKPTTVVGVLPEDFELLDPSMRLWVPLALERGKVSRQSRDTYVLARMAPGVSQEHATQEMKSIAASLAAEFPETNRGYTAQVTNLREDIPDSNNRQLFVLLQGALVFVLLIACANIANLLLARSQSREREIAVRASLGAGRFRLVRQLLAESLLLAGAGGAVGAVLSLGVTQVLRAGLAAQIPRAQLPVVDARVLAFTFAVTLLAGVLFGLAPVLQSLRFNLVSALKDGARGSTDGGGRRLLSKGLVVGEIALALVLLAGSSMLIRAFLDLQHQDPGFRTENLLMFQTTFSDETYTGDEETLAAVDALEERLASLPGVTGVLTAQTPPRFPFAASEVFTLAADPPAEGQSPPRALWHAVTPTYFEVLGIPLLEGRLFERSDRQGAPAVVVVNRTLADRFWPEGGALGQRIVFRGAPREVVGISGDVMHSMFAGEAVEPALYLPLAQQPVRTLVLGMRGGSDVAGLAESVRSEVEAFDAALVVAQMQILDEFLAKFFVGTHIFTAILVAFGLLAMLLASLGIYGVLAFAVAQRTHEIGVRVAIGARRAQVMGMITRQGLLLAAVGIALGVPGVLLVTRTLTGLLSTYVAPQPQVVVGVGVLLAVVTVAASWLPARRAAGVDPIIALRSD